MTTNTTKISIKSNAPDVTVGVGNTPAADSKTLTANITPAFHLRPASTQGTEFSMVANDGTGLCK